MATNSIADLSISQLKQALATKERIEVLQLDLRSLLGAPSASPTRRAPAKKRAVSAAGRARIAASARARWAKLRATRPRTAKTMTKAKRKISAAERARLAEAARRRWAAAKRAGKKSL